MCGYGDRGDACRVSDDARSFGDRVTHDVESTSGRAPRLVCHGRRPQRNQYRGRRPQAPRTGDTSARAGRRRHQSARFLRASLGGGLPQATVTRSPGRHPRRTTRRHAQGGRRGQPAGSPARPARVAGPEGGAAVRDQGPTNVLAQRPVAGHDRRAGRGPVPAHHAPPPSRGGGESWGLLHQEPN